MQSEQLFQQGDIVNLFKLNLIGYVDFVYDSRIHGTSIGVRTTGNAFTVRDTDILLCTPEEAMLWKLENL